ncbi:unnamed protein product [Trichogramma brassicae]|uniref:Uncharacterized protein n=1 Tax=Trichogramma brassicae TaxID=86971 RepID=A0A6H5I0P2_9HYME|nr:unnamed protein product [Trichogramma brassicae]
MFNRFDANYVDEDGLTHFHVACKYGCMGVVKKFLELGQDPNIIWKKTGDSPLHLALKPLPVTSARTRTVELLLRNGADPNLPNSINHRTPLHLICLHIGDRSDFIEVFFDITDELNRPAQIDARDKFGRTPLHLALSTWHKNTTKSLLRRGANPNSADIKGWTALHIISSQVDYGGFVDMFFEYNDELHRQVQVDPRDEFGNTPLHLALKHKDRRTAATLLRRGADANAANADGSTPLHTICQKYWDDDSARIFLETNDESNWPIEVDARDNLGRTPLQLAVAYLMPSTVGVLLNRGADLSGFVFPNESNLDDSFKCIINNGRIPRKLTFASGLSAVVERLEKRGYELSRSDAVTIMKLFSKHGLSEKSTNLAKRWYDDEAFAREAKESMVNSSLSLHDLIQLRPDEAAKFLKHEDYCRFSYAVESWKFTEAHREAYDAHLSEPISRGFYRRWAMDPFMELMKYRLPHLPCEMIMDYLENEDLFRICIYSWWTPSVIESVSDEGAYEWAATRISQGCRVIWFDTKKARELLASVKAGTPNYTNDRDKNFNRIYQHVIYIKDLDTEYDDHHVRIENLSRKSRFGDQRRATRTSRSTCDFDRRWQGRLPDLENYFCRDDIDWLLTEALIYRRSFSTIVKFVVRTGYRDEPELDTYGKPILQRTTLLHRTAIEDWLSLQTFVNCELFKMFNRFDANYVDEDGLTHFHVACKYGCMGVVKKFFELGQDPNIIWKKTGDSPLHLALKRLPATNARTRTVELLLRNGADPNMPNSINHRTPLHLICLHIGDRSDFIEVFFDITDELNRPAQIDARDKFGRTPLHLALWRCHKNTTKSLLRRGANPNSADIKGWTALHIISSRVDYGGFVEMFFEYNDELHRQVQVDPRDEFGNTPLHLALKHKDRRTAATLLRRGADANAANADGSTPLHTICQKYWDDDSARIFLETNDESNWPIEVDARDNLGRTPLQLAVAYLMPSTVGVLLNRGADLSGFVFPNESNLDDSFKCIINNGRIPRKLTFASGLSAVVERLEKRGYELSRSDAVTIMKLFSKHGLSEKSTNLAKRWYDDEAFAREAKESMVNSSLSLHDLIQLRPDEAAKFLKHEDYCRFSYAVESWKFTEAHREAYDAHLSEPISRGFYRRWAMDPFMELMKYRLPHLPCEMIMDYLENEDLFRICVAASGQS